MRLVGRLCCGLLRFSVGGGIVCCNFFCDDIHKLDSASLQFTTSSVFSGYVVGLTFSSFDDVARTEAKKVDLGYVRTAVRLLPYEITMSRLPPAPVPATTSQALHVAQTQHKMDSRKHDPSNSHSHVFPKKSNSLAVGGRTFRGFSQRIYRTANHATRGVELDHGLFFSFKRNVVLLEM
jgi:hypothetical protein